MNISIVDGDQKVWSYDLDSLQLKQLKDFASELIAPTAHFEHTILSVTLADYASIDDQEEPQDRRWEADWRSLTHDERRYVVTKICDDLWDGDAYEQALTYNLSRYLKQREDETK